MELKTCKNVLARAAGCRIPATTTRERRRLQGHRRVHGVCTEGRLLLSVCALLSSERPASRQADIFSVKAA